MGLTDIKPKRRLEFTPFAVPAFVRNDIAASSKSQVGYGFDGRVGLGVDHYLTPAFSVGGLVTSDFLFLGRSAMTPVAPKGSGTGIVIAGSAVLGLHF